MEDVVLDPSPMLVRGIARAACGTGRYAHGDRDSNLDQRAIAAMTTRFQIPAILRDSDAGAAGWTGEVARRQSGAHPSGLVTDRMFVFVVLDSVMRMWGLRRQAYGG